MKTTFLLATLLLGIHSVVLGQSIDVTFNLQPDGSGKLLMVQAVAREPDAEPTVPDDIDQEEMREAAAEFGTGVSFVSAKPLVTKKTEGIIATYAFKDINTVSFNLSDEEIDPEGTHKSARTAQNGFLTFQFTKGETSSLTIALPKGFGQDLLGGDEVEGEKLTAEEEQEFLEIMRQTYGGTRSRFAVRIPGRISQTNAKFVDGDLVSVMDVDFDALFAKPEAFLAFVRASSKGAAERLKAFEALPGFRVEVQSEIKVQFK